MTLIGTTCSVCSTKLGKPFARASNRYRIDCPRCGMYEVSDGCLAVLGDSGRADGLLFDRSRSASVGHWLRSRQIAGGIPILTTEIAQTLAKEPWFPSLRDQRENLIRLIATLCNGPGEQVNISVLSHQFVVGSRTPHTIEALLERLKSEKLVVCDLSQPAQGAKSHNATLTFDGWLAYEDISHGKTTGRMAFMAMPFNKPDLDNEWLPRLRTAVSQTGFTLKRVDDEPKPGLIDIRMQVQIKEARFLVVELTHANNGAYWEAGFAAGLGKPVIYTIRKGEQPHFDVEHWLCIKWDPENLKASLETVKATIRNELPDALTEPD